MSAYDEVWSEGSKNQMQGAAQQQNQPWHHPPEPKLARSYSLLTLAPKQGALTRNGRGGLCCQKKTHRGLPGGPVSRTSCFHYKGFGFHPWSMNPDPAGPARQPKKERKCKVMKQVFWCLSKAGSLSLIFNAWKGNQTINVVISLYFPISWASLVT